MAKRILVGIFGAAQGVRGEVRLRSFTADPAAIMRYDPLWTAASAPITLLSARPLRDDLLVVRVEGVTDRDHAKALTGIEIFVDRDRLPPPDAEEFYHADLIGLAAELADGRPLGRVRAVEDFGGGPLLEIAPGSGEAVLVPFTRAFVPAVDFAAGRIVIEPGALGDTGETEGPA